MANKVCAQRGAHSSREATATRRANRRRWHFLRAVRWAKRGCLACLAMIPIFLSGQDPAQQPIRFRVSHCLHPTVYSHLTSVALLAHPTFHTLS